MTDGPMTRRYTDATGKAVPPDIARLMRLDTPDGVGYTPLPLFERATRRRPRVPELISECVGVLAMFFTVAIAVVAFAGALWWILGCGPPRIEAEPLPLAVLKPGQASSTVEVDVSGGWWTVDVEGTGHYGRVETVNLAVAPNTAVNINAGSGWSVQVTITEATP